MKNKNKARGMWLAKVLASFKRQELPILFTPISFNMMPIQHQMLPVIDLQKETESTKTPYANLPLALVNDHIVRLSIMTEPYFWHLHPNSDESFLVLEGSVFIDLEDVTIELLPNQLFTIPKNIRHRTRPGGTRSVNLTFESQDMETIRLEI